ncbi:MAG: recombinase family protein, partial [Amphiplicatus sp.]|nr:recombinase family protein [Amphiplicatus sp.]
TGGLPPLGYDNVDKKLITNEEEAKTVRRLYELYLETGCIRTIIDTATREGLTSKKRADPRSGGALTRGPVYFILSNPIYAGLVRAGKTLHEGEHEAIIDRKTWEAVQAKRLAASQRAGTKSARRNPLAGLLYADGARLTPTYATKDGRRYRYYASRLLEKGPEASRLRWRVNAERVEAAIIEAIDDWLASPAAAAELLAEGASADDLICVRNEIEVLRKNAANLGGHERLAAWAKRVTRINLDKDGIAITLSPNALVTDARDLPLREECIICSQIKIGPRGQGLRMILGETETVGDADAKLVDLVRRAHAWRERWFSGEQTRLSEIAEDEGFDLGDVSRFLPLAFLAPDITKAILNGSAPETLNVELLRRIDALPPAWSEQRRLLGFVRD